MIEYIASRIARAEHEQMVRSLMPVQDFDVRLKDDRLLSIWPIRAGIATSADAQRGWVSAQVERLFNATGDGLVSLGEWIKQRGTDRVKPGSQSKNSSVLS